jgi:hypothetical protein
MAVSVGEYFSGKLDDLKLKEPSVVLVGTAQSWLPELVERARKLKVNGGFENGTDLYVHSPFWTNPSFTPNYRTGALSSRRPPRVVWKGSYLPQ